MARGKLSKEEALSFLLTYIVVERSIDLDLNQVALFQLTSLAQEAADTVNSQDGTIPHEVIESLAAPFIDSL